MLPGKREQEEKTAHKYLYNALVARPRTRAPLHRYNSRLSIERAGNAFLPRNPLIAATPDRKGARDARRRVVERCRPIRSTCCKAINIDPTCPPSIQPTCSTATVLAGCGGRPQKTGKRESDRAGTKSGPVATRNRHATFETRAPARIAPPFLTLAGNRLPFFAQSFFSIYFLFSFFLFHFFNFLTAKYIPCSLFRLQNSQH